MKNARLLFPPMFWLGFAVAVTAIVGSGFSESWFSVLVWQPAAITGGVLVGKYFGAGRRPPIPWISYDPARYDTTEELARLIEQTAIPKSLLKPEDE